MRLPLRKRPGAPARRPGPAPVRWTQVSASRKAWLRWRAASVRWAVAGAVTGAVVGAVAFAPATWLARAVESASDERVLLRDTRGTVWSGSAVAVLAGGVGSRDAAALPGRLTWLIAPAGAGFDIRLAQTCCLNGTVVVRVRAGLSRWAVTLVPPADWVGQWPSAWLGGLGTPWNTLQLGGTLRLLSPGLSVESVAGRWRVDGQADLEVVNVSSRLSALERLGDYRLRLVGDTANAGQPQLSLLTLNGPLQLSGVGTLGAGGLHFRGEARAAQADAAALANLLNIIGRRDGTRSIISIG